MTARPAARPAVASPAAVRPLRVTAAAALAAAMILSPAAALAQQPARQAAPAARPAAAAPAAAPAAAGGQGLDALNEEAVMNELAGRGLNSLLNRLFDERKVPKEGRDSFKALQAIRELGAAERLSNAKRVALLRQSVDGLTSLLPQLNDPTVLEGYAATLITKGIEPDIDTLEYWGDNPATMARVRPAAKVAVEMLEKVSKTAAARAEEAVKLVKNPNDPRIEQYVKLDEMSKRAQYVAALTAYYEALAVDASGNNKPAADERKKVADEAIKVLSQFDNPDSGVGPIVKLRIGKLHMAKADYAGAKRHFQAIVDKKMLGEDKKPVDMTPEPSVFQQNDARYFAAVSDVLAKKADEAEKAAGELAAWQQSALPKDEPVQKTVGAQMLMLQYRIASAKADAAPAGAPRDQLNKQADAVLTQLGEKYPQFQSLITEMLVTRLPDTADLKKQGVPVLQALITRGDGERNKPDGAVVDPKILARGLEAARVMAAKRPGDGGATPGMVETAALMIPLFLQKQGKVLEAADGFLDYGTNKQFQGKPNAPAAIDQAAYMAFTQYQAKPQDPEVKKLYARALEVAANPPFARKEVFYPYADWLRTIERNPAKAAEFYRKIPKADKLEYNARYFELVCLNDLLDKAKDPAQRAQRMREMTALIGQVRPMAQAAVNAAGADAKRLGESKFRLAYVTLLGADLALQQKKPKETITLLNGFEASAAGVPNEQGLKNKAMFLRATALINDGQIDESIKQVQQLAGNPETAEFAIGLVGQLLDRLGKDFDVAKQADDRPAMAAAATNQAKLTGFLVPWAQNHKDPKVKANADKFVLYDANTKRKAGELLADGPDKTKVLEAALKVFADLQAKLPQDSTVNLGTALTQYELKRYEDASGNFAVLIRDGRVGGPTSNERDEATGGYIVKDNPVYWETMYKWIRSNAAVAKKNPDDPTSKKIRDGAERAVKDLFITHREQTGGDKWEREFGELRKELVPGWEPGTAAAAPATQPADTQPATAPAAPTAGATGGQ